jgi:uncharacterized protein YllA (UPF0747 family)
MMAKNALINPAELNTFPVKPVCMVPVQDHDFEDENVTKHLEKVWSSHLADQKMLPKISFVSKAEFERREDREKVSKLLYTTETNTNLEISPKRSPSRPRTTHI